MERGPLLFLGTGELAVPLLNELVRSGENVAAVVTGPDRPKGRGRRLAPSPVGEAAEKLGLRILKPESVNAPDFLDALKAFNPEFVALADYGQFLRPPLLALARLGAVNLHPSLLPRWRGPSPVAWTILNGDKEAGVTVMLMDEGMDSGPILAQESVSLETGTTAGELSALLAARGASLFCRTLDGMRKGIVTPKPQDHAKATVSAMAARETLLMDWALSPSDAVARINAFSPRPGVRASFGGSMVKLLRAIPAEGSGVPGKILASGDGGIIAACGNGAIRILDVHPEGRAPMRAADFANTVTFRARGAFDAV